MKRRIRELQKELSESTGQLKTLVLKVEKMRLREEVCYTELRKYCQALGLSFASLCPAYRADSFKTSCLVWDWKDTDKRVTSCISCPVGLDEARVRVLCSKIGRKEE